MSVIDTGSFGLKRSRDRVASQDVPVQDETRNKRFKLVEYRSSVSPTTEANIPFVDVGETSPTGCGMFSIKYMGPERHQSLQPMKVEMNAHEEDAPRQPCVFQPQIIKVLPSDRRPTAYIQARGLDFTRFEVQVRYDKDRGNDPEVVFWTDLTQTISKQNDLLSRRKYREWLNRAASKNGVGEIGTRIFTKEVMNSVGGVSGFLDRVNDFLLEEPSPAMLGILAEPRLTNFTVSNVGQMLLAFLVTGDHLTFGPNSFKTRIMFLFLERMVNAYGARRDTLLIGHLYAWLVLRTCDSCFEKVLLDGEDGGVFRGEFPYSLESYAIDETRYMTIAPGSGLDYEIETHTVSQKQDCMVWRNWQHSYIRPRYAHGVMNFRLYVSRDERVEVVVQQHWGMTLLACLEGLHKGLKRAIFGGGNSALIRWANDIGAVVGADLSEIRRMLVDLVMIYQCYPLLRVLAENVFLYIILCTVPSGLVEIGKSKIKENGSRAVGPPETIDFFDLLVRFCCFKRAIVAGELMQVLLNIPDREARIQRLAADDVGLTLAHYIL